MLVIALTGGIGSGKTSVAMQLAELGAGVIDADQVAREVVVPGSESFAKIVAAFGAEVLSPEGTLNRPLLRARVFADPAARARLETILHPPIRAVMRQRLAALHTPYAVLVIPLLIETGQTDLADRVLVVDIPEAEQIRRVRERDGMDETSVRHILAAQCDRPTRLRAADDIVDNSRDPAHLREQTERLHHRYLALAREPSHSARPSD
jgi:dephospho-CoA kinase